MAHLEELAAAMAPDAHGLTVLPFFQGPRAAVQPQPGASAGPAGDDGPGREPGECGCRTPWTQWGPIPGCPSSGSGPTGRASRAERRGPQEGRARRRAAGARDAPRARGRADGGACWRDRAAACTAQHGRALPPAVVVAAAGLAALPARAAVERCGWVARWRVGFRSAATLYFHVVVSTDRTQMGEALTARCTFVKPLFA